MSDESTTKKTGKHDWSRFDALAEEQVHAAALADPDAQPLTEERLRSCSFQGTAFLLRIDPLKQLNRRLSDRRSRKYGLN